MMGAGMNGVAGTPASGNYMQQVRPVSNSTIDSDLCSLQNVSSVLFYHAATHAKKSHVIAWFQPGMFSPGQHAPPPYPGQGQPSHLQPTTPMFVAPPPKTQRVLHSEAYLKYIEGLNSESNTVSKWDQMLKGGVSAPNVHLGCLYV